MGQAYSCFRGSPECVVAVNNVPSTTDTDPKAAVKAAQRTDTNGNQQQLQQQQQNTGQPAAETANGNMDPSRACCLGMASEAGAGYDVTVSGPPLPGCETERLEQSHLGELLDFAPRDELQNILALVCNMFSVQNALVSLFFDRRVYIIDGTGVFAEGDFPWRYSMCGWTMASERHCVMIVNDVLQDARFCNSPVAKKYGVRFYVGAPLVSSSGHRIGTLCFADSKPRIFDDNSLKLLCNFSELVTRALERDIVVTHHQQMAKPGEALKELEHKHKYGMLLRSIDSVSSAVLLVDTATPGWAVRYVNSGWHDLLQRGRQSQATQDWVNASNPTAGSSSGPLSTVQLDGAPADAAAADPAAAAPGGSPAPVMPGVGSIVGTQLVGWLLWPKIEEQLARDPDSGSGVVEHLQELLKARQAFTLHGLELPGLGEATASFVFRPAGESDIDGSVNVCVPTWIPGPAAVESAAAALQATAEDHEAPKTICAPWQTLYFVSVLLETPQQRKARQAPGLAASTIGSFSVEQGRRGGSAAVSSPRGSSGITLSVPSAGQVQDGAARCVYDDSNLMVLSGMSNSHSSASSSGSHAPPDSSTATSNSGSHAPSLVGSCVTSITSGTSAAAARAVCRKIEGLHVGGLIASGSFGRVYRGDYYGSTVAVKVLESDSVLRREAVTGLCLEALLGEKFRHPNVVATLAWAVVTGKSKMAAGKRLWGETLDEGRPSIAENKAAVAAANGGAAQQQVQPALNRLSSGASSARDSMDHAGPSVSQQLPSLGEDEETNSSNYSSSSLVTAETWLVLEYANKGCLQDCIDRGWMRDGPSGPVSLAKVVVTAAEVAAGMYTLHKADVVHGDLSPYNVLLSSTDPAASEARRGFVAKISDFGLSRPMGGNSKMLTKTYGTITHMSPELLEHGISSKAVDVYSFGVLLWQMLASSRAWAGLSHHAVVHSVCIKKLQLQFPPEAPEALVQLGQACMSYQSEDRPTFKDILEVLLPLRQFVSQQLEAA